ncbi:MAG: BamA/TamA family outer membrane protein [Planctomycetota bacterium]|jgi:hypothetical protein
MKTGKLTKAILLFHCVLLLTCLSPPAFGQNRIVDVNEGFEQESFLLPYPFYNEDIDFALGVAGGFVGRPQDQMTLVGTGYSTNSSWAFFLLGWDIQTPFCERLFLDPYFSVGQFDEMVVYKDGNPEFPTDRAGSNESHEDNFLEGRGNDYFTNLEFKYLLPIGHGKDNIINEYVVRDGFLVSGQSGGDVWDPFESGRTYFQVEPFYRRQTVETDFTSDAVNTNGMIFSVLYDNTDFQLNPSRGSSQEVAISRDWGLFDSSDPWTVIEGEFSKYISLGPAAGIRQQVLAFNCWTANTLTWKKEGIDENGKAIFRRPPTYVGATLGGIDRMRGYPAARFNDQAAIYYALEYRVIPDWNPFKTDFWRRFEIEWIQGVLFAEVGRVAERWTLKELHSDMKWDVGVGLRIWAKNLIVRADIAFSEEDMGIQLMTGHPF